MQPDTGVSRSYWQSHYDSMADHLSHTLFEAEARDYFARLDSALPLERDERVLDFGCGLGFISGLIVPKVGSLGYWDYAENMLAVAERRLQNFPQAAPLDLADPAEDPEHAFDRIVVNSVIQYMDRDELAGWLCRWRGMLDRGGRLIISDIILPESSFLGEAMDTLKFAAREGFLVRTLVQDFLQYARYLRTRKQATMARYAVDEIRGLAAAAGLGAEVVDGNLTYKKNRYTVVCRPAAA